MCWLSSISVTAVQVSFENLDGWRHYQSVQQPIYSFSKHTDQKFQCHLHAVHYWPIELQEMKPPTGPIKLKPVF